MMVTIQFLSTLGPRVRDKVCLLSRHFSEVTASLLLDPFSPPGLLGHGSGDFSDPGDISENFVLQARVSLLPLLTLAIPCQHHAPKVRSFHTHRNKRGKLNHQEENIIL